MPPCGTVDAFHLVGPMDGGAVQRAYNASANHQPYRVAYWVTNNGTRPVHLYQATSDATLGDVYSSVARSKLPPNETAFGIVELSEGAFGAGKPGTRHAVHHRFVGFSDGCRASETDLELTVDAAKKGESARPGVGVLVHTAGFWENGTLFYTNMDRVHNDTRIHKGGWYEYEDGDPLKVYIYNQSGKQELPPRYNGSRNGVPPETGNVYSYTIPGFNEALKTMQTTGSAIVYIPPEKAYTTPERQRHPLYGDALIFYIEILDVIAINCPVAPPTCDPVIQRPGLASTAQTTALITETT